MLLELIVEIVGLIGEIVIEGLFELGIDFVSDWLTRPGGNKLNNRFR